MDLKTRLRATIVELDWDDIAKFYRLMGWSRRWSDGSFRPTAEQLKWMTFLLADTAHLLESNEHVQLGYIIITRNSISFGKSYQNRARVYPLIRDSV